MINKIGIYPGVAQMRLPQGNYTGMFTMSMEGTSATPNAPTENVLYGIKLLIPGPQVYGALKTSKDWSQEQYKLIMSKTTNDKDNVPLSLAEADEIRTALQSLKEGSITAENQAGGILPKDVSDPVVAFLDSRLKIAARNYPDAPGAFGTIVDGSVIEQKLLEEERGIPDLPKA